jgi:hypothetical protein
MSIQFIHRKDFYRLNFVNIKDFIDDVDNKELRHAMLRKLDASNEYTVWSFMDGIIPNESIGFSGYHTDRNGYNSIDRHPITKGKFNGYIIMPVRLVDDNGKVYPHNMSYEDMIASQQSMLSKHYQKMIA